jgi:hypothetical protein
MPCATRNWPAQKKRRSAERAEQDDTGEIKQ